MDIECIRYIVHPDDKNHIFFNNSNSNEFQEIVAHIDKSGSKKEILQIHDRLTIPLKNTGYIRYIVHPEDEVKQDICLNNDFPEIRILFDENEEDKKPFIAQVNGSATVPDSYVNTNVYAEIKTIR